MDPPADHARDLLRFGLTLAREGESDQALAAFAEADAVLRSLIARASDPGERGRLEADLLACLAGRADLLWARPDADAGVVAVYDEAIPLFRRRARTDDLIFGLYRRAAARWHLDQNAAALADCDEGLAALPAADRGPRRGRFLLLRSGVLLDLRRFEDVAATCDAALTLLDPGDDGVGLLHFRRAVALHHREEHAAAVAGFDTALPYLEAADRPAAMARAEQLRAVSQAALGRHDEAEHGFRRAARLYRDRRDDGRVLDCLRGRIDALAELDGRDADLVWACDEALPLLRRGGPSREVTATLRRRAAARERLGRDDDALADWDEVLKRTDAPPDRADVLLTRARLLQAGKQYTDALGCCNSALALRRECPDDPGLWGRVRYRRAELLSHLGRWDEAVAEFDLAVPLLDQSDLPFLAPRAAHTRALALAAAGAHEPAAAGFDDAADRYAAAGEPQLFGRCKHRAAEALMALGRAAAALDRFDAALPALARGDDEEAVVRCLVGRSEALGALGRDADAAAGYYAALRRLGAPVRRATDSQPADATALAERKVERAREHAAISADLTEALTRLVPGLADPADDDAREAAWVAARAAIQAAWEAIEAVAPAPDGPPAESLPAYSNGEAVERFLRRDYYGCCRLVAPADDRQTALTGLLAAVSARRLGEDAESAELAALVDQAGGGWRDRQEVRFAVGAGRDDPPAAGSDEERCRVEFCRGQRALTRGDTGAARRAFEACVESPADCHERTLAAAELAADLDAAPARAAAQARVWRLVRDVASSPDADAALAAARRACAAAERDLDPADLLWAECQHLLGALLLESGASAAAEAPLRRSLVALAWLELLGHPLAVRGLNTLADLCRRAGRWAEAGRLAERSVAAARTGLARDTDGHATALIGLARADLAGGRGDAAAAHLRAAVRVLERLTPFDAAAYGAAVHNLTRVYVTVGNPSAATRLLREARHAAGVGRRLERSAEALAGDLRQPGGGPPFARFAAAAREYERGIPHPLLWVWPADPEPPESGAEAAAREAEASVHEAEAWDEAGDAAGALAAWAGALDALRRAHGECHPTVAAAWYETARLLRGAGRPAVADRHLVRCAAVDRALGPVRERFLAAALGELGDLRTELKQPRDALLVLEEAFHVLVRVLGEAHPQTLRAVLRLAPPMSDLGLDADARNLLTRVLDVCRQAHGDAHPLTADFHQLVGQGFLALHDPEGARPHLRAAYDARLARFGDDDPRTRRSYDDLLTTLTRVGAAEDVPLTEDLFRRLMVDCERYMEEGTDRPDDRKVAAFYRLATMLRALGQHDPAGQKFESAAGLLDTALGMACELHGPAAPVTVRVAHELARALYDLGNFPAAVTLFRRVCGPTAQSDMFGIVQRMTELACCLVAAGEADEGANLLTVSCMSAAFPLALVRSGTTDRQRELYLSNARGSLHILLSYAMGSGTNFFVTPEEVYKRVLAFKGVVLESAMFTRAVVLGGRHPELVDDLGELARLKEDIARRTLAGPGPEGVEAHRASLDQAQVEYDRRETDLAAVVPELRLEVESADVDLRKVAAALPAGSALVEFIRYPVLDFAAVPARGEPRWRPARYAAFVLPAGESDDITIIDLGEAAAIDGLVDRFRAGFAHDGGRGWVVHDEAPREVLGGAELRAAVFDPLRPALGGRTRLLLAPDGNLTQLPFEVLPRANGSLLHDHYRISYVCTGRDVLRFGRPAGERRSKPLVVAAPDYDLGAGAAPPDLAPADRRGGVRFGALPNTATEGTEVARLLGADLLLGCDAAEGALKARCRAADGPPSVLHLATHGYFLDAAPAGAAPGGWVGRSATPPENPLLRAGLALAGANTFLADGRAPADAEDGMLTAEDVAAMDLLGTELVALSACDTARGEVRAGEGVFGLQRAFLVAGAKTLLMSLWKVPDDVTCELMTQFYTYLLGGTGTGRAEALHLAQLAVRTRHPDPYYWGAFICLGDPASLPDHWSHARSRESGDPAPP